MPARLPETAVAVREFLLALLAISCLFSVADARAATCGDDIGGIRVPCACGDVVVSDTTLRSGDPVVSRRCPIDGLIVRAAPEAESISLDLNGLALVGSGTGTGLRIDHGGSDGALVVGGADAPGEIVGFATGVLNTTPRALRRLERLHVKGSRHDGITLRIYGALLVDVSSTDNGGDGIRLAGQGGRLVGVEASGNRGSGLRLDSRGTIAAVTARSNGRHGVVSDGAGNDLSSSVVEDNGGNGILVRAARNRTERVQAGGNALEAIRRTGVRRGAE